MNRPYSVVRKSFPYHYAGTSVFDRFFCVHWSVFFVSWSSNESTRTCPSIQHDFALVRPQYISPLFRRPFGVFVSKLHAFSCMFNSHGGTFLGLQAFKLFSSSRARMVSTDAAIFKPFLSYIAGLNGSFLLCRHNRLTSNGDITGFRPRASTFYTNFLAMLIFL